MYEVKNIGGYSVAEHGSTPLVPVLVGGDRTDLEKPRQLIRASAGRSATADKLPGKCVEL
jgi:hypothetical protein